MHRGAGLVAKPSFETEEMQVRPVVGGKEPG
jgi:hypothetical protein